MKRRKDIPRLPQDTNSDDHISQTARNFKLLQETIKIEGGIQDDTDSLSSDFFGKTPMQAAKLAFLSISGIYQIIIPRKSNFSCIFSIQENGGANKLYTYRGVKEFGIISIKACKKSNKNEPKKPVQKIQPPLVFFDDGFHIEKKVIPPLGKQKKNVK